MFKFENIITFVIVDLLFLVFKCDCTNLTIMGHAESQTLLEAAVLAFIAILLLDSTGPFTALIL